MTQKKYTFWAILSGDINLARKKENYQKIIKMFKKRRRVFTRDVTAGIPIDLS